MSLLLDALKKASQDKKNNNLDEEEASLELDLEEDKNDFPEVELRKSEPVIEHKDDFIESINHQKNYENNTKKNEPDIELIEDEEDEAAEIASGTSGSVLPSAEMESRASEEKNKQALSALINKSQNYHQSQRKKYIGLLLAAFLIVFILFGVYLVYVTDYQQDSIYISDDNIPAEQLNKVVGNNRVKINQSLVRENTVEKNKLVITKEKSVKRLKVKAKLKANKKEKTSKISVVRTKIKDPVSVMLQNAYQYYQQKKYQLSLDVYAKILEKESKNQDAWLGLAANYYKLNQDDQAIKAYQQVLKLNPGDSYALAALASLEKTNGRYANESELKTLIRNQPEKSHLHFALGVFYSGKNNWSAAQGAFFNAWSLDNKSSTYAYNLAVSLDHLGQYEAALKFYRLSVKYNNNDINVNGISQRITDLSAQINKTEKNE